VDSGKLFQATITKNLSETLSFHQPYAGVDGEDLAVAVAGKAEGSSESLVYQLN